MSEQIDPNQPRILNTTEQPDGSVKFKIDASARSIDVFATVAFIEPDIDRQQRLRKSLLRAAVEEGGLLDSATITLDDPTSETKRRSKLSKRPTMAEVEGLFSASYSEEDVPGQLDGLLAAMIDRRLLKGSSVTNNQGSEFATADDASIAGEMIIMASKYGNL